MRYKKTQWVLLVLSCFIFFLLQNKLFSAEQKRKIFELNKDQEKVVDLLNAECKEKERRAFSVNMRLTEALTERLGALVQEQEVKSDKKCIAKKLNEFVSNLSPNAFISQASSIEQAFNLLKANERFERVFNQSEEMAVSSSVLRVSPETVTVVLYFTECPVEWGPSRLDLGLDMGSDKFSEKFITITGTAKSEYLKFILHTGKIFYFECEGCKKVVKEISVDKDEYFSVTFPVQMFGKEERRVAVLARDSRTEKYVLVDYLLRR